MSMKWLRVPTEIDPRLLHLQQQHGAAITGVYFAALMCCSRDPSGSLQGPFRVVAMLGIDAIEVDHMLELLIESDLLQLENDNPRTIYSQLARDSIKTYNDSVKAGQLSRKIVKKKAKQPSSDPTRDPAATLESPCSDPTKVPAAIRLDKIRVDKNINNTERDRARSSRAYKKKLDQLVADQEAKRGPEVGTILINGFPYRLAHVDNYRTSDKISQAEWEYWTQVIADSMVRADYQKRYKHVTDFTAVISGWRRKRLDDGQLWHEQSGRYEPRDFVLKDQARRQLEAERAAKMAAILEPEAQPELPPEIEAQIKLLAEKVDPNELF